MRFTDLLLASAGATLALAAPPTEKRAAGKFLFTGSNEAGGEFGEGNLPGTLGKDYTWPTTKSIDVRTLPRHCDSY
jgi:endoglucanase